MPHDFQKFPELTNAQLDIYYHESPHKQITDDFTAKVVKVHDGDTITVSWSERDFPFQIRFANLAAPELSEEGGKKAQSWLENILLGQEVEVILSKQRVEKWGRILGTIIHQGQDVAQQEIWMGLAKSWDNRKDGMIIDPIPVLNPKR